VDLLPIAIVQQNDRRRQRHDPPSPIANLRAEADVDGARRMRHRERIRLPKVDERGALHHRAMRVRRRKRRSIGQACRQLEQWWSLLIQSLELCEVRRRLREIAHHRIDERGLRLVLQHRVEAALLAYRGVWFVANPTSAERSGAVSGMDLHTVAKLEQLLEDRDVEIGGEFPSTFCTEKIRPTHRAHKQRVSGKHSLRISRMFDEERNVLRRVPWSMNRRQAHIADAELFAVVCFAMRNTQARSRSSYGDGTCCRQLTRSGHEVGMNMCLDRKRQGEVVLLRELYVDADITAGIHHGCQAGAVTGDHKRALSKPFIEDSLKHAIKSRVPPDHSISFIVASFEITIAIALVVVGVSTLGGALGALLGVGGGVFLVPFLNVVMGLPFNVASGVGLMSVIATSSVVSAATAGRRPVNLRLGMVLQIASSAGGLTGGVYVAHVPHRVLYGMFAAVTATIAGIMVSRLDRRNVILDAAVDPGSFGGRFFDEESRQEVVYRTRNLPVALAVSIVAGSVSGLLGIGGGILQVPALNAWCGVPLRVAAATSAVMIGVTAVASAPIYYARGDVVPPLAACAVIGVLIGSRFGFWFSDRARAKWMKLLMAGVLAAVSLTYVAKAL
jgi:uncharacterized protein